MSRKNLIVGQSGGPTAVINSSLYGVVSEGMRHPEAIEHVYGMINGIEGFLNGTVLDFAEALPGEKLLLSVDPTSEEEKQLGAVLEQKAGKLHTVEAIHSNANALEQAKFADGVILCVRVGKTVRKELLRAITVCRLQNIVVSGIICISEKNL